MDGIANLFIRRPGIRPCASSITIGSHIDSQPNGVRLDGVYGVAVGLELLQTLDEANIGTEHPVDVAIWTNEEGCRFSPGAMGSAFFTGSESLDHLVNRSDAHGILLEQALAAAFAAFADAPIREYDHAIAAYLEPHIEQGPVLETNVIPIGIVTGIQGVRWCDVEIE
ncbi:MAG: M20/M25/M40 family metallo-hydrolase, partial [Thermomicrobiales bacterium]